MDKQKIYKQLKKHGKDAEPSFTRTGVNRWFKVLLIGMLIGTIYINVNFLDGGSWFAHIRTGIVCVLVLKSWQFLPEFLDAAQEAGIVLDDRDDGESSEKLVCSDCGFETHSIQQYNNHKCVEEISFENEDV